MRICNATIPLIPLCDLPHNGTVKISKEDINFLVIVQDDSIFVIEDRCGHFGISLKNGEVKNQQIRCPGHGARFCLNTGELLNNMFENCDPLTVFL
ncbi:MAG: Rieske 2Fe-2S domain-containing protein, partial [Gammaproteobacteria bacterium]|nr:Rieske 2Fe-2S domain-containing protein [Gammaproteobacteria bacterium]